jgi:hypothetical protein
MESKYTKTADGYCRSKLLLSKFINLDNVVCRYYGWVGGEHHFMVGGYYYSVDTVIEKVWRTA